MDSPSASKENEVSSNCRVADDKARKRLELHRSSIAQGNPASFKNFDNSHQIDDVLNKIQDVSSGHRAWMVKGPQGPKFKVRNVKRSSKSHNADWSGTRKITKSPSATNCLEELASRKTLSRVDSPHRPFPSIWTRESFNRLTKGSIKEGASPLTLKHRNTREEKHNSCSPSVNPNSAPSTVKTKGEANMTRQVVCPLETEDRNSEIFQQANLERLKEFFGSQNVEEAEGPAEQASSAHHVPDIEQLRSDLELERARAADFQRECEKKEAELDSTRKSATSVHDRLSQAEKQRDRLHDEQKMANDRHWTQSHKNETLIASLRCQIKVNQAKAICYSKESAQKSELINSLQKRITDMHTDSTETARLRREIDAEYFERENTLRRMLEDRTQEIQKIKPTVEPIYSPPQTDPGDNDEVLKHCSLLYKRAQTATVTINQEIMCVKYAFGVLSRQIMRFTQNRVAKTNPKGHQGQRHFALAAMGLNLADILKFTAQFLEDVNSMEHVRPERLPKLVRAWKCLDIANNVQLEDPIMQGQESKGECESDKKSTIKAQHHQTGLDDSNEYQGPPSQQEHEQKVEKKPFSTTVQSARLSSNDVEPLANPLTIQSDPNADQRENHTGLSLHNKHQGSIYQQEHKQKIEQRPSTGIRLSDLQGFTTQRTSQALKTMLDAKTDPFPDATEYPADLGFADSLQSSSFTEAMREKYGKHYDPYIHAVRYDQCADESKEAPEEPSNMPLTSTDYDPCVDENDEAPGEPSNMPLTSTDYEGCADESDEAPEEPSNVPRNSKDYDSCSDESDEAPGELSNMPLTSTDYDGCADESDEAPEEPSSMARESTKYANARNYGFDTAEFPPEFDEVLRQDIISSKWNMTIPAEMVRTGYTTWQVIVDRMHRHRTPGPDEGEGGKCPQQGDADSGQPRPASEASFPVSDNGDEDGESQDSSSWEDSENGDSTDSDHWPWKDDAMIPGGPGWIKNHFSGGALDSFQRLYRSFGSQSDANPDLSGLGPDHAGVSQGEPSRAKTEQPGEKHDDYADTEGST